MRMKSLVLLAILFYLPMSATAQLGASASPSTIPVRSAAADTTRNAALFPGRDIGERIHAALEDCHRRCTVRVPAGDYSFSTTIRLPVSTYNPYTLELDRSATLTYTGSGDAISVTPTSVGGSRLLITGGQLLGNPAAKSGIHLYPTNMIAIRDLLIKGFSSGDGVFIEGTNSVLLFDNTIMENRVGLHLAGAHCSKNRDKEGDVICGRDLGGDGYAPNAIHVIGNAIVSNAQWGVWEEAAPGVTPALGNLYLGNNLELNGLDNHHGAMLLGFSLGTQVISSYFEGPSPYIVVGAQGTPAATGVAIRGNYFTVNANAPISIELANAVDTAIEDNSQYDAFPNSPAPCFIDIATESGTYLGKNHIESQHVFCRGGKATLPGGAYRVNGDAQAGPDQNGIGRFVGQLTTTGSATDILAVPGLSATGHCAALAGDAKASTLTGLYAEASSGAAVVHHAPGGAGGKLNLFCSSR